MGVGFDADDDERRIEGRLGDPIDGRAGDSPGIVLDGEDINSVGNHPEDGLLGVSVHSCVSSRNSRTRSSHSAVSEPGCTERPARAYQ